MAEMQKDKPWLIRTYAGHSTAKASNALYRSNLAKGQTGLSVAFDLPTQTGYDSDHALARGEVGKVGVPVSHLGDMRTLFENIPLEQMNTSMTINATAPWLLALYIAVAEEQGAEVAALQGTVQNDLIKEYLSRGTYICPPAPSLRMIADVAEYCYTHVPKWNPMNVCSYHLQEAGATPEQELAFALATGIAVLDALKPRVAAEDFPALCGRISFFVNERADETTLVARPFLRPGAALKASAPPPRRTAPTASSIAALEMFSGAIFDIDVLQCDDVSCAAIHLTQTTQAKRYAFSLVMKDHRTKQGFSNKRSYCTCFPLEKRSGRYDCYVRCGTVQLVVCSKGDLSSARIESSERSRARASETIGKAKRLVSHLEPRTTGQLAQAGEADAIESKEYHAKWRRRHHRDR